MRYCSSSGLSCSSCLYVKYLGHVAQTCSAIEVEEAAAGKMHKLLAFAVVVE